MLSKLSCFFRNQKVKPPIQKDLEKSNDNDEFAGTDQVNKEKEITFYQISQMPYIVNVENTTNKSIEDVVLFFGNSQNELEFDKKGSYVANGLIISSGVPNVTYNHIVKNVITNKCNIKFTYIQSENNNQIVEELSIKIQDANGTCYTKTLSPKIDPYQQQNNIVAIKEDYTLDGNTAIILHQVHPKTILKMYFYPEIKIEKITK